MPNEEDKMLEDVKYLKKNVVKSLRKLGFKIDAVGIAYEFEDKLLPHIFVPYMDIPSKAKTTPQILSHVMNRTVQAAAVRGKLKLGEEIRNSFVSAGIIYE